MSLGMRVAKLKGGGRKTVLVDVLKENLRNDRDAENFENHGIQTKMLKKRDKIKNQRKIWRMMQ